MVQFKKLILHNFGSYNHAEVDLLSRGFCLVSGQNNYKKDNALSNGAGKSFLWSAISYAITGETISGLKNNLKNIMVDENLSYTTVDFNSDQDNYIITRTIAPKSDLKIIKNGTDVSGKGIRESEKKLGELLPDLTRDLIASTILIGQGMPNKFSSFSPSGRKELLEKLTKSDFMIEDIKNRVLRRQDELNHKIREFEDSLLVHRTQLQSLQSSLDKAKLERDSYKIPEYETEILKLRKVTADLQTSLNAVKSEREQLESLIDASRDSLLDLTDMKTAKLKEELDSYNMARKEFSDQKARLDASIYAVKKEIQRIQAIKDVCPTCGQRLPNIEKPSTVSQEAELKRLTEELTPVLARLREIDQKHAQYQYEINAEYDGQIAALRLEQTEQKKTLSALAGQIASYSAQLQTEIDKLTKLEYDQANHDKYLNSLKNNIAELEKEIAQIDSVLALTNASKDDFQAHLAIIKRMDTLIKRDFRGYLLTNIIDYIDQKAKDFCEIVFETRELDVYLDGNALDIAYCGKMFDSLSGGEKQRVDLILQFAIRDMLSTYLDLTANIIVLDEITDFLDKKSCKAVMSLLEKELNSIESVFIISHHHEELELPIDSELKIVKNTDGISEVLLNAMA